MSRKLYVLILVVLLAIASTSPVLAGGDKVRGDNGQGTVAQWQWNDPPPF
jgi:hypothetical protein